MTTENGKVRAGRDRFATLRHPAEEQLALLAYRVGPAPMTIVPAPTTRAWIEAADQRFSRRCLPLMLANQAGWFLLGSHTVRATWDGGRGMEAIQLEVLSGEPPSPVLSHFGDGILTFSLPYLFRTPPGWNLLARGPANWPKEGAFALEGLIETDWAMATFTMNWKLTAVDQPVTFEAGEPFCMLVPQRRGDLERFAPRVLDVAEDPDVSQGYAAWSQSRAQFLAELPLPGSGSAKQQWQKHYFRGIAPDGTAAPAHQTKLDLREVDDAQGWSPPDDWTLGT